EAGMAEEMVIQEVEMAAAQAGNFGESVVHLLGVEAAAAGEEGIFVAEVAMLGAAAGDHDGVGHEVMAAADEVAADGRDAIEGAAGGGAVQRLRMPGAELGQELGKGLFAGAEEDGVGMGRGFIGKGG